MKHVVQVGLNKTTEYNFLAPAHFGKRRRDLYILPYDLDMSGDWMYHGIECNPEIFAEHRETLYLETPSEKFYNVAITGTRTARRLSKTIKTVMINMFRGIVSR